MLCSRPHSRIYRSYCHIAGVCYRVPSFLVPRCTYSQDCQRTDRKDCIDAEYETQIYLYACWRHDITTLREWMEIILWSWVDDTGKGR